MAILRASEIKEMKADELDGNLTELQKDLMKIKGVLASGGVPENVGKTKEIRRTIARILTIKKEEELKNREK